MSSSIDVNGPPAAPDALSAARHSLSAFPVEHLVTPPAPTSGSRWSRAFPFVLALLLNIAFLFALFYRVAYTLPPMSKEKEAIPVELVKPENAPPPPQQKQQPKPQPKPEEKKPEEKKPEEKKPEPQKEKPYEFKGSGDVTKDKAGHAPVVKADDTKAKPEKKAEKPKEDAPKQTEIKIPDWAKTSSSGYDLPKPKESSRTESHGSQTENFVDKREGDGAGDEYSNRVTAQINKHTSIPIGVAQQIVRSAIVGYVLDRRGALRGVRLLQSSGNNEFDLAVIQGIVSAAPFPAFPSGAPDAASFQWVLPQSLPQ